MVNYQNGKVYKIWSTAGDKIYIGSTTKEYLSQRMDKHRSSYKGWKNRKDKYMTSYILFDEYGLENCFIELLEAKSCDSKDELHQLEGIYIRKMTCVNKVIPFRTAEENKEQIKQWFVDNKEHVADYKKNYHASHIDIIKEQKNRIVVCDCGKDYTCSNRARHLKSTFHITNNKKQETVN